MPPVIIMFREKEGGIIDCSKKTLPDPSAFLTIAIDPAKD
jgi:hypothetical protein